MNVQKGPLMITLDMLLKACAPGGASVLTSVTELRAAAGEHASVAPAKFVDGNKSVFAFETRYIDGQPANVVVIDSKQSSINRGEQAVSLAIRDGNPILCRIPRMVVDYGNGMRLSDWDLPHRFADGHLRAGSIDGQPTVRNEKYIAVRNSTMADASAVLNTAPAALLLGGWDSTRKANQLRLRSALVGEIIGVLADQQTSGEAQLSKRGGARVDPVAAAVKLDKVAYENLLSAQESELSPGNLDKNRNAIKKAKKGELLTASSLGLGAIPPSLESLGGVSCRRVIRSWVLSFATLRQLRFGTSAEANEAARALLAALGLAVLARAEQELYLRANCDLIEASAPEVTLDLRHGDSIALPPLTVEAADSLLEEALIYAEKLGAVQWHGQTLDVIGSPDILGGATDEAEDE